MYKKHHQHNKDKRLDWYKPGKKGDLARKLLLSEEHPELFRS